MPLKVSGSEITRPPKFSVGDVIRVARVKRRWNQERLGRETALIVWRRGQGPMDKNTISKIERDPYSSEFGNVWRAAQALGLSLGDLTSQISPPFLPRDEAQEAELVRLAEKDIREKDRAPVRAKPRKKSRSR